MESQDWFNWSNIVSEAGEHRHEHDSRNHGGTQRKGDSPDWALDDIINDIEHQMDEQNDALAGMAKKLEDIEVSLTLHEAATAPAAGSSRFRWKNYISMGDDDNGDADGDDKPSTISSAKGIMRVLKRKSLQNKQDDKSGSPAAEVSPVIEMDTATTASTATRHTGHVQSIMADSKISIVKYGASSRRDVTPPNQARFSIDDRRLHVLPGRIEASIDDQEDEIPPPPPPLPDRQVSFNMNPVTSEILATPKPFRSSTTWEESDSSSGSESGVSELEETLSGKTWAFRSRGAKMTLICLAVTLILMLGLVIGQSQGARNSQQAVTEQSSNNGFDAPSQSSATSVPASAPTEPSMPSPPTTEDMAPPANEPSQAPFQESEPTSPADGPTPASADPPTAFPTEVEEVTDGTYDYTANTDYLVGVYYYPWYGENFHNGGGYMRKDLIPKHQPTLGEYTDSDPAVIKQHMKWFRKANIGLLVTSWWGPGGYEDRTTKDVVMEHEDIGNLKIAIHYETTGRIGNGTDPDRIGNALTDIEYMCGTYFNHPNYYKIDDRPVLFIYVSRMLETVGSLEETLLTMRSTASKCGSDLYLIGDSVYASAPDPNTPFVPFWYFDAVTNYDVYGSSGRPEGYVGTDRVDDYYIEQAKWKQEAMKDNCHYIPAVSPGYNDRGVRMENDHPPLSRSVNATSQEGSLFHYQLGHAKLLAEKEVDKMILVNSFNEWHEDTQIEPAVGDPATLPFNFTKGLEYVGYKELYLDILGAATSKDESQHTKFDYLYG